jgi:uncharacterized membrane protein
LRAEKDNKLKSHRLQPLVFVAFALGAFFRFGGLGKMMYSHDEIYTSLRAAGYTGSEVINSIWDGGIITRDDIQYFLKPSESKDVFDTLSTIARSMPQLSPLYFISAHYWMRLVGSSPASMRGLAALFSLFAIPGMYWLSLELFKSRRIALVSAVLISLSPFSILFAHDARQYSLWASAILLSSAALLTAIRKNRKFDWSIYSLSLIFGIYSHQLFVLVAVAHWLYMITFKESRLEGRFVRYLFASLLAALAFTPWLYQVFTHWNIVSQRLGWANTEYSWLRYIQYWLIIFASPFIDLYIGARNIIPFILRIPVLLLIGYALYFLVVSTPKRIWAFLLLLIGVTALPLFLSDLFRGGILSAQGRYFVSANVAIIPVVTHLLVEKLSIPRAKPALIWYLVTALLLAAQLGSAYNILWAETWWTKKHSWIDPQIGHVLNQANHPLLIVNGLWPTDLGDVLAISLMVNQDVSFMLHQTPATIELPEGFSNIYWFHQTYWDFIESESGKQYQATEVVPYFLWRIDNY